MSPCLPVVSAPPHPYSSHSKHHRHHLPYFSRVKSSPTVPESLKLAQTPSLWLPPELLWLEEDQDAEVKHCLQMICKEHQTAPTIRLHRTSLVQDDFPACIYFVELFTYSPVSTAPSHIQSFSANEKLQLLFNETTFKGEMELYEREGLDKIEDLVLPDNSNVISVIGGKKSASIFGLLDDENKRREAGSNEDFFRKILRDLSKGSDHRPKRGEPLPVISGDERKNVFLVRHFAGDVAYSPDGFVQTNADTLIDEIRELLASSASNAVIAELFGGETDGDVGSAAGGGGAGERKERSLATAHGTRTKKKKEKTVSGLFRHDIDSLVRQIGPDKKTGLWNTDPHYIRCIKSNGGQQAAVFEDAFILKQLRCAGIPEAGSILRAGYPFRLKHLDFRAENERLAPPDFGHPGDDKKWCHAFVSYFVSKVPQFEGTVVGKTMVLCGGKHNFHLMAYRTKRDDGATLYQAQVRGWLVRSGKMPVSLSGPPDSPPPPSGVAALAGLRHSENGDKDAKPKPLSGLVRQMSKHSMQGVPNNSPHRITITARDIHEERHF